MSMLSYIVRNRITPVLLALFCVTMVAGTANAADLVKPGAGGVYLNSCTNAPNPTGRNTPFSCASWPTQWVTGTSPNFSCLTAATVPTIPANQVYNCDTAALQCYSAVYSCSGCVLPTYTVNSSCSASGSCPLGGGVYTTTCGAMGCPSGKSLCGSGPGSCVTTQTCSGGQTWNGCACTGTAYALVGAASPAGYLTVTGDITASGKMSQTGDFTVTNGNVNISNNKSIVVAGSPTTSFSIGNDFTPATAANLFVFGTVNGRDGIMARNGSFGAGFKAPTLAADRWWTLPASDATAGTGYYLKSDGAGILSWGNPSTTGAFLNGGNTFGAPLATPAILGTLDAKDLTLRVGGATVAFDRMTINNATGNIGIGIAPVANTRMRVSTTGTNNKSAWFEAAPSTTNTMETVADFWRSVNGGNGANGVGGSIDFGVENSVDITANAGKIGMQLTTATAGAETSALTFWTRNAGAAAAERVRVDGLGNMGIGVAPNAGARLHVYKTGSNAEIALQSGGVAGDNSHWGLYANKYTGALDNSFNIWGGGSNRLTINPTTGNVGLGLTPGVAALDILDTSTAVGQDGIGINLDYTDSSADASGNNFVYGTHISAKKTGMLGGTAVVYGGKLIADESGNTGFKTTIGVQGQAFSSGDAYGSYGTANGSGNGLIYGAYGSAVSAGAGSSYGVWGSARSDAGGSAYGTYGTTNNTTAGNAYGAYGVAQGVGPRNYGGYFTATGISTIANYGLYTTATGGATNYAAWFDRGNVGIGTGTPNRQLHVYDTVTNPEIDIQGVAGAGNQWGIYNRISDNSLNVWGGSDHLTVMRGGNIGIGNANPGSKLDVKGTLRLSGATSGYVGFAPPAVAGSTVYTLPSADGTNGHVLSTNGAGTLSWAPGGNANAFINGGNTFTSPAPAPSAVLGTNDANSLSFETNNVTRMTISGSGATAGNIGIGGGPSAARVDVSRSTSTIGEDGNGINIAVTDTSADSSGTNNTYGVNATATRSGALAGSANNIYGGLFTAVNAGNAGTVWTMGVRGNVSSGGSSNVIGAYGSGSGTGTVHGTYGSATLGSTTYGAYGTSSSGTTSYGTYGNAMGTGAGYGGYGTANSPTSYGMYGRAVGTTNSYGSFGSALGTGTTNYGGWFSAIGGATTNYGIYASVSGGTTNYAGIFTGGNFGIGDTTPLALLTVGSGDLFRVDSFGRVQAPYGASGAGNLAYSFVNDTGLGLYRSAANQMRVQTAGIDRVTFDAAGRVGIGTTAPNTSSKLHIRDTARNAEIDLQSSAAPNAHWGIYTNYDPIALTGDNSLRIWGSGASGDNRLTILTGGNIGIGDTTPASLLTVGNLDTFQVDSSGDIVKIKNVTYSWPPSIPATPAAIPAGNAVLTTNTSGTMAWSKADACTVGRKFVGMTPAGTPYNGGRGGYKNANLLCDTVGGGTGGTVCTVEEMLNSVKCAQANVGADTIEGIADDSFAWMSGGPSGSPTIASNDCQGWNSASPGDYGRYWLFNATTGGVSWLNTCDKTARFACCK